MAFRQTGRTAGLLIVLLSFLLAIASAYFWVRSDRAGAEIPRKGVRFYSLISNQGSLGVQSLGVVIRRGDFSTKRAIIGRPLTQYKESPANYAQWEQANQIMNIKVRLRSSKAQTRSGRIAPSAPAILKPPSKWPRYETIRHMRIERELLTEKPVDGKMTALSQKSEEWLMGWRIWIPYWLLVIIFMLLPIYAGYRRMRYGKRTATNCCPSCGYDLRASPERCPECGRPTDPAHATAKV